MTYLTFEGVKIYEITTDGRATLNEIINDYAQIQLTDDMDYDNFDLVDEEDYVEPTDAQETIEWLYNEGVRTYIIVDRVALKK